MKFDWNDRKIDFKDMIQIFAGPHHVIRTGKNGESRWKAIGRVDGILYAVFIQRETTYAGS